MNLACWRRLWACTAAEEAFGLGGDACHGSVVAIPSVRHDSYGLDAMLTRFYRKNLHSFSPGRTNQPSLLLRSGDRLASSCPRFHSPRILVFGVGNPQVTLFRRSRRATGGDSAVPKAHVVSSVVEHPAVTRCLDYLAGEGQLDVTYVGVDEESRVSVEDVKAALRPTTALVTIMHSNNEVGVLGVGFQATRGTE